MAQRQYMRKIRTGSARFEDVYRAVSEYRLRYPDKAVIYSAQKYAEHGWASIMAGASCANIPVTDSRFLKSLTSMKPRETVDAYLLEGPDGWVVCAKQGATNVSLDLGKKKYTLYQIDQKSGVFRKLGKLKDTAVMKDSCIYWITSAK